MDKTQTIALFGGSFDPPHIGHENIVKALLSLNYIDKVVIMPTFLNPFKSNSHASANLRLKWLKTIFKEYKNVQIDDFEVKQNKKVPTIESVEYLLTKYSNIYLTIGADNLMSLKKWYKYDKLQKKVSFIVAHRNNIKIPESFLKLEIKDDISSTQLRKNIDILKLPKSYSNEIYNYYKGTNQ
ncbi:MAG: nicotinate (nicotinamide) nucleotide adenylyltransferase [Campylobacterota bacterium]|nr:nicotinate (nicotinamide) nucleotide adenylyltransferase [Campylobacterota bacterium]